MRGSVSRLGTRCTQLRRLVEVPRNAENTSIQSAELLEQGRAQIETVCTATRTLVPHRTSGSLAIFIVLDCHSLFVERKIAPSAILSHIRRNDAKQSVIERKVTIPFHSISHSHRWRLRQRGSYHHPYFFFRKPRGPG